MNLQVHSVITPYTEPHPPLGKPMKTHRGHELRRTTQRANEFDRQEAAPN
jgi:hypothetical protein